MDRIDYLKVIINLIEQAEDNLKVKDFDTFLDRLQEILDEYK